MPGSAPHSATPEQAQLAELRALVARLDQENVGLRQALAEASAPGVSGSGLPIAEERNLFLRGPVVVFKWRNEPGWPVEYVSPNVAGVFGYSAEAFLSGAVPYAELIHPDDLARVGAEVSEAGDSRRSSFEHAPYRVRAQGGRELWLYDFTTILRDAAGQVSHYLGYVIDVSDRVHAEQQRQAMEARMLQAQKLESLGVLTGGIAHDFNNLLTSILGNAELAGDASEARRQVHLDAVTTAARRAAGLCNQMLAYAGRGRFEVGPVDLNAMVSEMAELLAVTLPKGVTLLRTLAPGLPPVQADANQLRQVVMNLITNAAESIESGQGEVRLVTTHEPAAGDAPALVTLEVSDDGCGMDSATRARIFEPFFSTKFAGRGLGLAAVQGIVRRLAGTLTVESTPGLGSRFQLSLPAVAATDQVQVDAHGGPSAARRWRGTALVVEDEASVREVLTALLERQGFDVLSARDGVEALELLGRAGPAPALVVLDITMPRMGGEETLPHLRALHPDVPVLLTSGYDAGDVLQRLATTPRVGFVHKPFTGELFGQAVAALLPAGEPD